MDINEDNKSVGKNKNKWSLFQRSSRNKPEILDEVYQDPAELQRVSFATSITDLPSRPSAFQQVLSQITSNKANPNSVLKMSRLHKKLSKDSRSPQNVHGSSPSPVPRSTDQQTRPRTYSNASSDATNPEISSHFDNKDLESITATSGDAASGKASPPVLLQSDSVPAGFLLMADLPAPSSLVSLPDVAAQYDTVDGAITADVQRNRQIAESLKQKIMKTSEAFKAEQAIKDENVSEYLQLTSNADKHQIGRIKSVFEKKNSKSNATLAQLKKKLDNYHKKLKEIENGSGKKGILGDVGANLVVSMKGGLTGLQHATQNAAGAIVNKPKEMASKLKSRFGSSDNIPAMKDDDAKFKEEIEGYHYAGSGEDVSSNSGSIDNSYGSELLHFDADGNVLSTDSPNVVRKRRDQQINVVIGELVGIRTQLQDLRENQDKLDQQWEAKKEHLHSLINRQLEEERVRYDDQLHDLNEFHQREMAVLKQELASMEDKMEYHARERARDMQEALESCQTRIAKMELQQQQQSVSVEGLENASARALLGKLINLLLSVIAVLLVLVNALSGFLTPFIKSQGRVFITVVAVVVSVLTYRHWERIPFQWPSR